MSLSSQQRRAAGSVLAGALIVGAALATPLPASAATVLNTAPTPAPVTTTDSFATAGATVPGFSEARGDWKVSNGAVTAQAAGAESLLLRDAPAIGDSYSVAADISSTNATVNEWNGVVVGASDDRGSNSYRYLTLRIKQGPNGNWWQLLPVTSAAADEVPLASKAIPGAVTGTPYRVILAATGYDSYRVTIAQSGTDLVNEVVSVPAARLLAGGRVGLYSLGGNISADNLTTSSSGRSAVDSFSTADGNTLGSAWTAKRGDWSVAGSAARYSGGIGEAVLLRNDVTLGGSFVVTANVLGDAQDGRRWNGIVVGSSDGVNQYTLRYTPGSPSGGPAGWQLLRLNGGPVDAGTIEATGQLAATGKVFDDAAPVALTLRSEGLGRLQVNAVQNGVSFATQTVPLRLGQTLVGGSAGLYSGGGGARYDDVRIATSAEAPFAFTDDFARGGAAGTLAAQQLAGKWQELRGDWSVTDGSATLGTSNAAPAVDPNAKEGILVALRPTQSDTAFSTSVSVKPAAVTSTVWNGLAFNAAVNAVDATKDDYYALQVAPKFASTAGQWRLVQVVKGVVTTLDSGQANIVAASAYTLRVTQADASNTGAIVVSISSGSTPVLAEKPVTLPAAARLTGGRAGIVSPAGSARFDDFGYVARNVPYAAAPQRMEWNDVTQRWDGVSWQPEATTAGSLVGYTAKRALENKTERVRVGDNFSMSGVGQALYTVKDAAGDAKDQYVGYYDENGWMTIAKRSKTATGWGPFARTIVKDPAEVIPAGGRSVSQTGTDTHNYIALAVSPDGRIHFSGNMHAGTMVYFVSDLPGDITSLKRRLPLVPGDAATQSPITYPAFITTGSGATAKFLMTFRTGSSGSGSSKYYSYSSGTTTAAGTWTALTSGDLFSSAGSGDVATFSSYTANNGPVLGPDGTTFHLAWVWRANGGDAGNGTRYAYASSTNMVDWYAADGTHVANATDPIRFDDAATIVDDVPIHGGALNGLIALGFDGAGKPVISYSRYDDLSTGAGASSTADYHAGIGSNQFFASRFDAESKTWKATQLTNYRGRWTPEGGGAINFPLAPGAATTVGAPAGTILLPYNFGGSGSIGGHSGVFVLDANTLEVRADGTAGSGLTPWIPSADIPQPTDMTWQTTVDSSGFRVASGGDAGGQYVMVHAKYPLRQCPIGVATGAFQYNSDGSLKMDSSDSTGPCQKSASGVWSALPKRPQPMTIYLSK